MVKVYRSTDVTSYTSGADISWSAEDYDTDAMWASGTTITINTAGIYSITMYAGAGWTGTATLMAPAIKINGTGAAEQYLQTIPTQSYGSLSVIQKLSVGNTITGQVGFSGGSAYIVRGAASETINRTRLSVTWIGFA